MRVILLVLAVLAGALAAVEGALPCDAAPVSPECFVALRPGPTRDVLAILEIPGEDVSRSSGQLLLTTVLVDRTLDLGDLIELRSDPTAERAARDRYFPPDVDEDVTQQMFAAMMTESELAATVAALTELGYELPPDGARIEAVVADGPSDGLLAVGEVVVELDGRPVVTSDEFADAIGDEPPGSEVVVTVRVGGGEEDRTLVLGTNPDDDTRGFAGLFGRTEVDVPIELDVDVGRIGGPSAGLMFALAIVDLLVEEDLTGGRVVAGTGEIGFDGRVGPIGGIRQKLPGAIQRPDDEERESASVFLLPRENVEEARLAVPGADLLLVPVDTLADAVAALRTLRDGGAPQDSFTLPAGGLVVAEDG